MHTDWTTVPATVTTYINDRGDFVGRIYEVPTLNTVTYARYMTEAHDWDTESLDYDPIVIGVFDDPEEAAAEIVSRIPRVAQTPGTIGADQ